MYKSRILIWVGMLLVFLGVSYLPKIDMDKFKKYDVPIFIDADTQLKTTFLDSKKTGNINFVVTNEKNSNVIIKNHSNTEIPGFKKYNNEIFTPIVLFVSNADSDKCTLISNIVKNSNEREIDFTEFLKKMIEEKTFNDIGFVTNKKTKSQKINIYIPTKTNIAYEKVIETLLIALNNNIKPTKEEKEKLQPQLEKILENCIECSNITDEIENYDSDEDLIKIFLAPESMINSTTEAINSVGYSYNYTPVYLKNTASLSYDVYLKENISINLKEKIFLTDAFEKNILSNKKFLKTIKYRTSFDINYKKIFEETGITNYPNVEK